MSYLSLSLPFLVSPSLSFSISLSLLFLVSPSLSFSLSILLYLLQLSNKRSSSFRKAIANGRRTLQREILLDETGLGVYKRFVRYVAYEILPCETDRRWYYHQSRLCPPPVFMAIITIIQVAHTHTHTHTHSEHISSC